jgi:hypothetical protein
MQLDIIHQMYKRELISKLGRQLKQRLLKSEKFCNN